MNTTLHNISNSRYINYTRITCLYVPMNPAERPISFTIPIPFGRLHTASVLALRMAACAVSTEVVKPKERSMRSDTGDR